MTQTFRGYRGLAAVLFFAVTGILGAQTTTITLEGVEGPSLGGVYTSPYYGTIGSSSTFVPIICDDFSDESYLPESWTAYVNPLSNITGGDPTPANNTEVKFTAGTVPGTTPVSLDQEQAYTTAAYLVYELLQVNQTLQPETAEDLSYALWGLLTPSAFTDQTNGAGGTCTLAGGVGCIPAGDLAAAESDVESAWSTVQSMGLTTSNFVGKVANVESVTIYTFDPGGPGVNGLNPNCGGSPCATAPPQEFISITTPEASAPILFGADLLGLAGLVMFLRRRRILRSA